MSEDFFGFELIEELDQETIFGPLRSLQAWRAKKEGNEITLVRARPDLIAAYGRHESFELDLLRIRGEQPFPSTLRLVAIFRPVGHLFSFALFEAQRPGTGLPEFSAVYEDEAPSFPGFEAAPASEDEDEDETLRFYWSTEDERPMVRVGDFWIDRNLVTNSAFNRFLIRTGRPPRADPGQVGWAERPALDVDHDQATAYAAWAKKRLPAEAEWDLAARGEFGVLDLLMVWEWTSTLSAKPGFVVRGGPWRDRKDKAPSIDNRSYENRGCRDVGFRCVRDAE